ncbi:MAG: DUF2568 domain-containing protein [Caldilinea sp. CFX5]|nr:DUF2568 domain-containing protein [Caldilinea sp. CFX5]
MLFAFEYWGWQSGQRGPTQWGLTIGLPLLAILVWGEECAPKARWRLSITPGLLLSLGLFLLAALALYQTQQPVAALVLAVVAILNRLLAFLWQQ